MEVEATRDGDEDVIRLRVLGASEIRCGRRLVTPATEVVFALGFYLCARAGERLAREDVSEVFWGEGRESQGRHSLRQMLYRLRQKGLELDEDGEELYLDPTRVDSDLATALGDGWPEAATAAEAEAAGLLAPGFTRPISERFQEWLDGIRDRLAAQHRRASLRQIALARREGRWADLDRWALQVLKSDPLNEEATLARAESAAISGSKAVALEIIDAYMEELGDRAPVIGLPASLLRRRIAERKADWSGRGRREVPLVGRQELMSRLTGYVDAAARGEGRSVVLWGAPGIGKTRLAEEACAYAEVEGFRSITVRAIGPAGGRPLSLLLSILTPLRQLPGALGCDPSTLAVMSLVQPSEQNVRPSNVPPFDNSLRDALVLGLTDLLDAVTSEGRLLLLTDDLHNADHGSLEILHSVIPSRQPQRLLWLGTSRTRPAASRGQIGVSTTPICVPPLDPTASEAMAESIAPASTLVSAKRIADAAGGNPLFVLELSAHPVAAGSGGLPRTLHEIISTRLASLDPSLLRLVRTVALLGGHASITRLKRLAPPTVALADLLENLEAQGMIRMSPTMAVELHECWQQEITAAMSPAAKAALSLECATLLEEENPRPLDGAWRAATLFAEIGESRRAVDLYQSCAEEMLARGLPVEARDFARRAYGLARTSRQQLSLLSIQGRSEAALREIPAVIDTCAVGLGLARTAGAESIEDYAVLLSLYSDALGKAGRDNTIEIEQLAALVQNNDLPSRAREFACLHGIATVYSNASSPLAEVFVRQAKRSMELSGESVTGMLVELIHSVEQGNASRVRELENHLGKLEIGPQPMGLRVRALNLRAAAQRFIGEWDAAVSLAVRAFELAETHRLVADSARVADLLIFGYLDQEDLSSAEHWLGVRAHLSQSTSYAQSDQALTHARARLCAHHGDYRGGLRAYESRMSAVELDHQQLPKGVDLATLAVCFAGSGMMDECESYLRKLDAIILNNRAGFQNDYIVEMVLRSHRLLDRSTDYDRVGEWYALKRSSEYPNPAPKAFCALNTFLQRISS